MNKLKYLSLILLVLVLSGCPASRNNVRHDNVNNNVHNNNNGHNQSNLVCATSQTTCATSNSHVGSRCECHHDGRSQSGTVVNRNNNNGHNSGH